MSDSWVRFGWQGLSAETPADWELVGIPKTHDAAEGYLRLDDADQPRFELKWNSHPQRKFDIEKTLDDYLSGIRKTYEKQIGPIEIRKDQPLIPSNGPDAAFHDHREVRFFAWRGELRAYGAIWRCTQCQRVVMAQVIGPSGGGATRREAVRVLSSIRDHPTSSTNLWTAYGLEMDVPRRFRLDKLQLLNGYILFSFTDGSARIAVERYGLADQHMKGEDIDSWFRRTYAKHLRGTTLALDKDDLHEGAVRIWDVSLLKDWQAYMRPVQTAGHVWRDASANRLFVVRATGKRDLRAVTRRIAESIPLHPSEIAGDLDDRPGEAVA